MKILPAFFIVSLLSAACGANATQENVSLPEMGDSATTALTPEEEQRIGRELMQRLRHSGRLLNDMEVEAYIDDLGWRLASSGDDASNAFTFFVIRDPSINAFAIPGGYIGIHSGLILASRTESELAGVVAHEIAHLTQHHIARSLEQAGRMNVPLTAAVIAAILLGAGNPQLGEAAIAASVAGSAQMQLDFSRAHEQEADRVGIQLLARAGLDPEGMPGFFERLQQESRYAGYVLPEFLSTHPITGNRIADARNRAAQYPSPASGDSLHYRLIKARLQVLEEMDPVALLTRLDLQLADAHGEDAAALRYARGLVLTRLQRYDESRAEFTALHQEDSTRIHYLLALARAEAASGHAQEAHARYQRALITYPGNTLLTLAYGESLLQEGAHGTAVRLLEDFCRSRPPSPRAYELLARAQNQAGQMTASHISLSDYHRALGEIPTALQQLHLAKQQKDVDFYQLSIIEAKLSRLRDEMPRRKSPSGRDRQP